MTTWLCSTPGCPSVSVGSGVVTGLRSIGWEVQLHEGVLLIPPTLRCPSCVECSAGVMASQGEVDYPAVARSLLMQRLGSILGKKDREAAVALAETADEVCARAAAVVPMKGSILVGQASAGAAGRDVCHVILLQADLGLVIAAARLVGWMLPAPPARS